MSDFFTWENAPLTVITLLIVLAWASFLSVILA